MQTVSEIFHHAADRGARLHADDGPVTVAALVAQSSALAAALRGMGVGAGDRVAAWMPNLPAYLSLYAATARLGAILVAVNDRFGAAEVADIVGRAGAKVLVAAADGADGPGLLSAVDADRLPEFRHLILCGDFPDGPAGPRAPWPTVSCHAFADLLDASPTAIDAAAPHALSNIFTTSGTTAAPKFAAHAQAGVAGHARDVARVLEMDAPNSVSLQLLPFCGVFGFMQVMAALAGGADIVMPTGFEAAHAAHLCIAHAATHMFATDDMIHRMIEPGRAEAGADRPFPSLKACAFALFNSYLADLPARAEAHGIPMLASYGMSEVYSIFAIRRHDQPVADRHRPGGTLVTTAARVRARDPETGEICGDGEPGELEIKGPYMFREYHGDADATGAALTADGYLRTGDIGYTEPGNAFTYLQRAGDTLRLGGFLVSPTEIEAAVMAAPDVADAQVVAVGTENGNRPVAFVIVEPGAALDERAVIAAAGRLLPRFKTPVRVIALDGFPVTDGPNGTKIQRARLRDKAAALAGK